MKSSAKSTFKIGIPTTHTAASPAVPASYAKEMSHLNTVTNRAMRSVRRRHR